MGRKTLSVDDETYAALSEHKQDGESWNGCLFRLATNRDPPESVNACEQMADVLTPDHIEDIATRTAKQTADEVENRLTGR